MDAEEANKKEGQPTRPSYTRRALLETAPVCMYVFMCVCTRPYLCI